jgi:hypothetical protein
MDKLELEKLLGKSLLTFQIMATSQILEPNNKVSLSFLTSFNWWQKAFQDSFNSSFAFWGPALLFSIASILVLLGTIQMEQNVSNIDLALSDVVNSLFVAIFIACLGIILSFWALSVWLIRLTAYARYLLKNDADYSLAKSIEFFSSKKAYLTKLWLIATVYILVPALPMIFLAVIWAFSQPQIIRLTGIDILQTPNWFLITLETLIVALSVICTAYALLTIAISSISSEPEGETATLSMKACIKHWRPILILATIVSVINLVIASPQIFLLFSKYSNLIANNDMANLIATFWLGITSMFLWPVSLAPFCQFVKLCAQEGN